MRVWTFLLALCVGATAAIASVSPASSATRRVVLLFDERPELPGLALLQADLVRTLTSNSADRIEVYNETMDQSRFGSNDYQLLLRDFLRAKYSDKKIDAVIAIFAPSLDFLLNYGEVIFPGTPVVFCGIDKTELGNRLLPPHVRGILVRREFAPTIEIALSLHPKTERAVTTGRQLAVDHDCRNGSNAELLGAREDSSVQHIAHDDFGRRTGLSPYCVNYLMA